jgi:hypothetical protein
MLRIRDVYPGSDFFYPESRVDNIPDPHQRKFNPKLGYQYHGFKNKNPGSGFFPIPYPDLGVKKSSKLKGFFVIYK